MSAAARAVAVLCVAVIALAQADGAQKAPSNVSTTMPADPIDLLIAQLQTSDPATRETAIRQLRPYGRLAARRIVELFVSGSLQARLAAMEMLEEWNAPVAGVDPWQIGRAAWRE